jgi:hypothetical protein
VPRGSKNGKGHGEDFTELRITLGPEADHNEGMRRRRRGSGEREGRRREGGRGRNREQEGGEKTEEGRNKKRERKRGKRGGKRGEGKRGQVERGRMEGGYRREDGGEEINFQDGQMVQVAMLSGTERMLLYVERLVILKFNQYLHVSIIFSDFPKISFSKNIIFQFFFSLRVFINLTRVPQIFSNRTKKLKGIFFSLKLHFFVQFFRFQISKFFSPGFWIRKNTLTMDPLRTRFPKFPSKANVFSEYASFFPENAKKSNFF